MADRTDIQQLVLDVLEQAEQHPNGSGRRWMSRYLRDHLTGGRASFTDRLATLHRQRFPDRRNRPQHRHIEGALRSLVAEGLVETREGAYDHHYQADGGAVVKARERALRERQMREQGYTDGLAGRPARWLDATYQTHWRTGNRARLAQAEEARSGT